MFTGIIQDIGEITAIDKSGDWRLRVQTSIDLANKQIGASIACSGCCLTVLEKGNDWFDVEVSQESLDKTILKYLDLGSNLNIEPSLCVADELGGHIVSGHVDGVATVNSISSSQDSHVVWFEVPDDYAPYIAQKGSIAIDGISLTINDVKDNSFAVNIISHTWAVTTIGQRKENDFVNFEVDMLARYIMRQREFQKD